MKIVPIWKVKSDINTVQAALTLMHTTVIHCKVPPEAHKAIKSLKKNHSRLLKNIELLYASLNISDTFPELDGLSLDFI